MLRIYLFVVQDIPWKYFYLRLFLILFPCYLLYPKKKTKYILKFRFVQNIDVSHFWPFTLPALGKLKKAKIFKNFKKHIQPTVNLARSDYSQQSGELERLTMSFSDWSYVAVHSAGRQPHNDLLLKCVVQSFQLVLCLRGTDQICK